MNTAFLIPGFQGPGEVLLILVVILLLFGAKRLPDLARSLGKSLSEFKKGRAEGLRDEADPSPTASKSAPDEDAAAGGKGASTPPAAK
jgi:sec-independent protein translocase protein TatA